MLAGVCQWRRNVLKHSSNPLGSLFVPCAFGLDWTCFSNIFFLLFLYLQLQHFHYLQYYYTNIYAYNMLANYTSYTYTTYTCTTLQYDILKKNLKNNLKKFETTYNTTLMLLRTILILQYNYLIMIK